MSAPSPDPDSIAAGALRGLSASAQRVQQALAGAGFDAQVFELEIPVRTAAEAARAVGCEVAQIAKSLIFRAQNSGRAVLVITSGANRVDEARVAETLGEPIGRADPDIDEDLLSHREVWAAAGHPNALFRLDPRDLARMTGGAVRRVH